MGRLEGKIAAITGAGSGIGQQAAILFAKEGASVAVLELNADAGRETVSRIEQAGGRAIFCETDVSKPESVEAAIGKIIKAFGMITVMYNNAGGSSPKDGNVVNCSIDEFWRAISLDLFGTWLCCRNAIPYMIKAGGGVIINTISNVALQGVANLSAYSASKGGVVSLSRAMAVDFAPHHIRVNMIEPSATLTDRLKKRLENPDGPASKIADGHLLGLMEPYDIANAALFLASDESRKMTGSIVAVDSGVTIH